MTKAHFPLRCSAGLIALGAALALPGPRAAAAGPSPEADAFPSYESYVKISGQSPWISGDSAAFASRAGMPTAGSGGIEDFYYAKDLSDTLTVKANGRALEGADDYLASLNFDKTNVGTFEAGYKRFRTFYDGVGGFFPLSDQFQKMGPEQLHVDRSTFWIAGKLARPDAPVFTINYHDEIRTGQKDSTEWGSIINPNAVIVKGALVGNALPANTPFISPNVLTLDEHHNIVDGSMVATVGKTTETLKATVDWVNNFDTRNYIKFPKSTVIVDPTVMVSDDQEGRSTTSYQLLNQTETKFSEHLALEVGLRYTHAANTNGGNWVTPTYSATANAVYNAGTAINIYGTSKVDDYVGNIFLKFTPTKDLSADLGFRDEANVISSRGGFQTTSLASGATTIAPINITTANDLTYSHYTDHVATPEVSVQYQGIDRVSLYATVDKRIDRGNQHWVNPYAATTVTGAGVVTAANPALSSIFFQQANQDYDDAKVGANWNACTAFTLRAEVFRKDHQNQFIGANGIVGTASFGGLYATGYTFTGAAISAILRPSPQWSFNTRYQPQSGNMSVLANVVTGGLGSEITSGKARGQQLGETVNWTPTGKIYLQGNINVVYSYIQTAYPVVVVSGTTNIPTPIQNANNNYVSGSALCGFVLDKETDAQLQGSWQHANNYNPQIATGGQPYGSSFREDSITAGLKHKFGDRLMAEGKLGYLERKDPTTGGFTNYRGPLAYLAFTYSL